MYFQKSFNVAAKGPILEILDVLNSFVVHVLRFILLYLSGFFSLAAMVGRYWSELSPHKPPVEAHRDLQSTPVDSTTLSHSRQQVVGRQGTATWQAIFIFQLRYPDRRAFSQNSRPLSQKSIKIEKHIIRVAQNIQNVKKQSNDRKVMMTWESIFSQKL